MGRWGRTCFIQRRCGVQGVDAVATLEGNDHRGMHFGGKVVWATHQYRNLGEFYFRVVGSDL